jgi:hypothetical protein
MAGPQALIPVSTSTGDAKASIVVDTKPIRVDRTLLFVLSFVVAAVTAAHQAGDAHFDFGVFYYAAHIVLGGARHALYDLPTNTGPCNGSVNRA